MLKSCLSIPSFKHKIKRLEIKYPGMSSVLKAKVLFSQYQSTKRDDRLKEQILQN